MVTPLEQAELDFMKDRVKEIKKEKPIAIEIKSRQLWMKDLERAEAEKRSHFRTEKEGGGGNEGSDVFDLEFIRFPSHNKSATPLCLSLTSLLL